VLSNTVKTIIYPERYSKRGRQLVAQPDCCCKPAVFQINRSRKRMTYCDSNARRDFNSLASSRQPYRNERKREKKRERKGGEEEDEEERWSSAPRAGHRHRRNASWLAFALIFFSRSYSFSFFLRHASSCPSVPLSLISRELLAQPDTNVARVAQSMCSRVDKLLAHGRGKWRSAL